MHLADLTCSNSFLKIVLSGPHEHWSGFTSHFTLTNMTGSFSTKVTDALKDMQLNPAIAIPWPSAQDEDHLLEAAEVASAFNISSPTTTSTSPVLEFPTPTTHKAPEHELRKRQFAAVGAGGAAGVAGAAGVGAVAVDQHTVPYGEQTGPTKYAPMPKRAGSTIATRSATPQYPPFPFSTATAYLGAPTVEYTEIAYATWTANSIENTVCLCRISQSTTIQPANLSLQGLSCSDAHIGQEDAKMARSLEGLIWLYTSATSLPTAYLTFRACGNCFKVGFGVSGVVSYSRGLTNNHLP